MPNPAVAKGSQWRRCTALMQAWMYSRLDCNPLTCSFQREYSSPACMQSMHTEVSLLRRASASLHVQTPRPAGKCGFSSLLLRQLLAGLWYSRPSFSRMSRMGVFQASSNILRRSFTSGYLPASQTEQQRPQGQSHAEQVSTHVQTTM